MALPPGYSDGEYADPTKPVSEQDDWLPRVLDASEVEVATWPAWKRDAMRREAGAMPPADDEMVEF